MSDRASYALTPAQRDELRRLLAVEAFGRDGARGVYEPGMGGANPNVLGILIDKGFVEKRVRTKARRAATVYWLTAGGAAMARQLLIEGAS